MADALKKSGDAAAPNQSRQMSTFRDCVAEMLGELAEFGKELKFGDAALKIHVQLDSVDLHSSSAAHVYSCLQQHISKLQAVSKSLKSVLDSNTSSSSTADKASEDGITSLPLKPQISFPSDPPLSVAVESQSDDVMVQIRAGKSEIERRISAFMERKQMEINENNVREFCNVIDCNQENSCARTDAVFTPYPGFKSHVKVTRVVNTYGPQTLMGSNPSDLQQAQGSALPQDCGNSAIEERLQNIEEHLKLPSAGPVPLSVYHRIKKVEDRILELEGLSPEYFQSTTHLHKRPKITQPQSCSLTELDEKISVVKAALLKKVSDFGAGYGSDCAL
ncbi:MAP3K12-binding inhibitory protein 1 [Periophthalmus magnuspinnatus]|uniref:MAP3K12-binding inhibitory protein 1 n=1 Tax=Periophthalmus magnuspinnatus TaxID=409849 RepID=UPI00145A506A|nr:MAP3K12-binding inhibitory protein 1 [Periophthalmus magnuspinnatus]